MFHFLNLENIHICSCILNLLKFLKPFNIEINFDLKKTYRKEIQNYVEN